jgi:NAD+ kinase
MKIAIYGKTFGKDFHSCSSNLFGKLQRNDVELFVYQPFYDFLKNEVNQEPKVAGLFTDYTELPVGLDYFFSIGGDGTFLETITFVRDSRVPVVGINSGRLGFLASISKEQLSESLDNIFDKKYSLEERTLLKFESPENPFGDFNYALNEVTFQKIDATMITIQTYVNDDLLNAYWADGLIISTPTGSTAYSLSVGGPIMIPDSNNFIISPIAPHNLTVRPVVIPDKYELRLKINGRTSKFLATLDFRSAEMDSSTELVVKRADFNISVLKLDNHNYYSTLRSKLMWGADKRN